MTLTQTAIITKQIITLTIIILIVGTTSFIGYKIWYAHYLSTLPPKEEKPDTRFGLLPRSDFPKASVSSSNFAYSLDTTTGSLPKLGQEGFEKVIKVFFVVKPYASLLSPQKSQDLARKFNIDQPYEILNETNYRFKDKGKVLTIDLDSGNFTYIKEATISATEKLDDDSKLISDFENFLSSLDILKPELREGRNKITLFKIEGDKFVPTQLRTEAKGAQISLWPKALDKKSIFTPNFNKALVNTTVINSAANLENYLSLNFTFWPVDEQTFATYPTKSPEDALADLKAGKGAIIIEPPKPQVSISSIYLGYYLSENYSPYLQPIYVFEGPQFVAYVSAISSQFIEQAK